MGEVIKFELDTNKLQPYVDQVTSIINRVNKSEDFYNTAQKKFPTMTQERAKELYEIDKKVELANQIAKDLKDLLSWYSTAVNEVVKKDEELASEPTTKDAPTGGGDSPTSTTEPEVESDTDPKSDTDPEHEIQTDPEPKGITDPDPETITDPGPKPEGDGSEPGSEHGKEITEGSEPKDPTEPPVEIITDPDPKDFTEPESKTDPDDIDPNKTEPPTKPKNKTEPDGTEPKNTTEPTVRTETEPPGTETEEEKKKREQLEEEEKKKKEEEEKRKEEERKKLEQQQKGTSPSASVASDALKRATEQASKNSAAAGKTGANGTTGSTVNKKGLSLNADTPKLSSNILSGGQKNFAAKSLAGTGIALGIAGITGGLFLAKGRYYTFTPEDWEETEPEIQSAIIDDFKAAGMSEEEIEEFKISTFKIEMKELNEHIKKVEKAFAANELVAEEFASQYGFTVFDEDGDVDKYLLFIIMGIDGRNPNADVNFYNIVNPYLEEDDINFIYTGINLSDYLYDAEGEEEETEDEEYEEYEDTDETIL